MAVRRGDRSPRNGHHSRNRNGSGNRSPAKLLVSLAAFATSALATTTSILPVQTLSTTTSPSGTPGLATTSGSPSATPTPTPSGPITTAPIYLPYYDKSQWSVMRGSIISSDASANRTTYTIFCPQQTPKACNLDLQFPFIFVEGPETAEFHGTYTSTFIANIECDLAGRTAATCSGYSSFKSGYTNGPYTGPTEVSWTTTFTGTDVEWGTLTLEEPPKATNDNGEESEPEVSADPTENTALFYTPAEPTDSGGDGVRAGMTWTAIVVGASTLFAGFLL